MCLKKCISILFFCVYLLSTTQLRELLKLPLLVEHFIEHKQEDDKISFFGFLYMHYANGSPKDTDYDKDMKLPFKSLTNVNIYSICFCTAITVFKQDNTLHYKVDKQPFFDCPCFYSSNFLSTIWQPPKGLLIV